MTHIECPTGDLHSKDASDHQLLEQIRAGHSPALDSLVSRYWSPLVAYAARFLASGDAASDVVQETFIRIWERREGWHSEGSVQALLYRITRNSALDEKKRTERHASWVGSRQEEDSAYIPTPSEQAQAGELQAAFERALAALPDRRRETFLIIRLHGLSYREAAEVMGIAPQTVANQLSAALADLRDALERFLDPSPHLTPSPLKRTRVDP